MLVWFWTLLKMWKLSIITSKQNRTKILPMFPFPAQFWIPEVEITSFAKLLPLLELDLVYSVLLLKTLFQQLPGRSAKMPKNLLEFLEKKNWQQKRNLEFSFINTVCITISKTWNIFILLFVQETLMWVNCWSQLLLQTELLVSIATN